MRNKAGLVLVGLIALIVGLLATNLLLSSEPVEPAFSRILEKANFIKAKPTQTPLIFPQVEPQKISGLPMFLPVRREDLATIPASAIEANRLIFFLPDKAPIYALINGRIRYIPANPPKVPFENVQIVSLDSRIVASYLIKGEILVEEGQGVNKGNLIAKAEQGEGISCLGGANLSIDLADGDVPVILNKATIKDLKGVGGK